MRLTQTMKDEIVARVLHETFKKAKEALQKEEKFLAARIYAEELGASVRKINSFPVGFFPTRFAFLVRFAGQYEELNMGQEVRVPYERHRGCFAALDRKNPLCELLEDWSAKKQDLKKKEAELRAKTRAVVEPQTTLKKLLEVWPEVKAYLPKQVPGKPGLPMVPVKDLNKAIQEASQVLK